MIAALAEARRRGLLTVAFVGYDGGRVAAEGLADHVVVTRSEHIPRIQEAQASAWHVLRELHRAPTGVSAGGGASRVRVEGTVQGVGFRPYVHRLAGDLGLAGFVLNDAARRADRGRGPTPRRSSASSSAWPPRRRRSRGRADARPRASRRPATAASRSSPATRGGEPLGAVSPDAATCADCLAELRDPADRRHRYPFVNCTACGPRFTIVRDVPYDRATHHDGRLRDVRRAAAPSTRTPPTGASTPSPTPARTAAPGCACWRAAAIEPARSSSASTRAAPRPRCARARSWPSRGSAATTWPAGADDEDAVARLRARKRREDKPFARHGAPTWRRRAAWSSSAAAEEALLAGRERPIVLAPPAARRAGRRRGGAGLGRPRRDAALLAAPPPAARRRRRRARDDERQRLRRADRPPRRRRARAPGGDRRPVPARTTARSPPAPTTRWCGAPPGRRSSCGARAGTCPGAIACRSRARGRCWPCGAELKSTFCVAHGRAAPGWATTSATSRTRRRCARFREGVDHFERLFAVAPEVVAHDLHPDYLSTALRAGARGRRAVGGAAPPRPPRRLPGRARLSAARRWARSTTAPATAPTARSGAARSWSATSPRSERAAHLRPVRMPGGERRRSASPGGWPARGCRRPPTTSPASAGGAGRRVDPAAWAVVARLARSELRRRSPRAPAASSTPSPRSAACGRGSTYEGQAAIELEAACDPAERGAYPHGRPRPARGGDRRGRRRPRGGDGPRASWPRASTTASRRPTAEACVAAAGGRGRPRSPSLSGGVFQNRRLLEGVAARLERAGLRVLVPERLPPNDGGISYGQAAVTAASAARP